MIINFPIPKITLPTRKKGQSYKEYDKEIDKFLKLYIKYYDSRKMKEANFYRGFKEDFFKDPSYKYIVKYMYKKVLDFSEVRKTGLDNFKEIKRKIPRKEMLKCNLGENKPSFMRWGMWGDEETYRNLIKKRFRDYIKEKDNTMK